MNSEEKWQRVFTGEEFIVEMNPASLTFEPDRVLRMQFRTTFTNPEKISPDSETKYKVRVETFEFKTREKHFRIQETNLLDSTGKVVQSWSTSSYEWKPIKGVITSRMLDAAQTLPPLGSWKVNTYHYADGARLNPAKEPPELARLIGTRVSLTFDTAEVAGKRCSFPAYRSRRLTDKELSHELGTTLAAIGVKTSYVDTVVLKCESTGWSPPQSLLIKAPDTGGVEMLWDGVFLVLKRQRD